MQVSTSRGGQKPRMLIQGSDFPLDIAGQQKFGIYEVDRHGVLARRVELPHWLSDALKSGTSIMSGGLRPPPNCVGGGGQIFIKPPKSLFDGPAVGVDMQVHSFIKRTPTVKTIRFCVYAVGHRLVDTWDLPVSVFLRECKEVRTSAAFMPQMMVPLSLLASIRKH